MGEVNNAAQKRPKILMVTTIATTLRAFLLPFAEHYRERGWEVEAMAAGASGCPRCLRSFDRVLDASWCRNPWLFWKNFAGLRALRNTILQGNYDLIHVHTPVASFVTRCAIGRSRGRPKIVYTAHGFHFHKNGSRLRNLIFIALEKFAGRWTDALIVLNREDQAQARRLSLVPPDRIFYMPGIGIDAERYNLANLGREVEQELRTQGKIADGDTVFLHVGEFSPGKCCNDLIHAFARLSFPAKLLFAGDGPRMGDLKALAARLGLHDEISFLGFRGDIPRWMRLADAVVLVSNREGLPRCVLEAMASARPVIGTAVRGTRDLLENGAGILVPLGDRAAIAAAMRTIHDDPQRAKTMGASGRSQIGRYEIASILRLQDELYDQLLQEAKIQEVEKNVENCPSADRSRRWRLRSKYAADKGAAFLLLLLSAPLWLAAALAVRVFLGAPVLFRQQRPGLHGRPFTLFKFRTMRETVGADGALLPDARRLTRFGNLLRASSIDELPQLWNVLRGEMSLVGPRPLLMRYLRRYTPEQTRRHEVRPGLTGWAQVHGRNALDWESRFALDIWYVDHWSLGLDFGILCRTLAKIVLPQDIRQPGHATMSEFLGSVQAGDAHE